MIQVPETAAEIQSMLKRLETAQMRQEVEKQAALEELQRTFEVDSIEEARKLLNIKVSQRTASTKKLNDLRKAFVTKWQTQLTQLGLS